MSARVDRRLVVELGLAVVALAAVGALAGVVWQWIWTPTMGVAVGHQWVADDAIGLQHEFSGTGWYFVVGTGAGLLAGIAVALVVDRVPLLTLVAVVVGGALAAWLMLLVGTSLGPADQDVVAATAADGTRIPLQLTVTGRSPWIAFPAAALVGLVLVFIGLAARGPAGGPEPEPETLAESPSETGSAR